MYLSQTLVDNIKNVAKDRNILIKDLLSACDLNINVLSQMTDKKGISSFALARIADYLDCSVDYLLGRTDNPVSHKQTIIIGGKTMAFATRLREVMRIRSQ